MLKGAELTNTDSSKGTMKCIPWLWRRYPCLDHNVIAQVRFAGTQDPQSQALVRRDALVLCRWSRCQTLSLLQLSPMLRMNGNPLPQRQLLSGIEPL